MKKIIYMIGVILLVTGCGKYDEKDVIDNLNSKIDNSDAYKLSGDLFISNNDDVYNYDFDVSFKKKNYYNVVMTNKANNYVQVILKNNDGVYIVTPVLNKSFKFQSDWPYDNSQIYLFDSIINDINKDKNRTFKENKNRYIFKTKVSYPNNNEFVKQKIEFNKNLNLKKVSVYDKNNVVRMEMNFNKIDYSPTFEKKYFSLNSIISTYSESTTLEETMSFTDVIYPLFLPNDTKLVDEEKIQKDNGQRVIMTFDGDKPFLLVEETMNVEDEFTIIPTYGEPYRLMDSLGIMTDNSLTWVSNGIEYYIVSDVLEQDEMIEIAQSIYSLPTMK